MNTSKTSVLFVAFFILFVASNVSAQAGGDFAITQSVIAGGGGQQSRGGTFSLDGTIGQAVAGNTISGSPFALTSGFWNFSPLAPTAATASISGRVTSSAGKGIRNVQLTLTTQTGEILHVRSGAFGFYQFDNLAVGQNYILAVSARRFSFVPNMQIVTLLDELTNVNFIGSEQF